MAEKMISIAKMRAIEAEAWDEIKPELNGVDGCEGMIVAAVMTEVHGIMQDLVQDAEDAATMAEEVKTGRWVRIDDEEDGLTEHFVCEKCESDVFLDTRARDCIYPRCPYCGSRNGVTVDDDEDVEVKPWPEIKLGEVEREVGRGCGGGMEYGGGAAREIRERFGGEEK